MQQDAFEFPTCIPRLFRRLDWKNWRLLQTRKVLGFLPITKSQRPAIAGKRITCDMYCIGFELNFLLILYYSSRRS